MTKLKDSCVWDLQIGLSNCPAWLTLSEFQRYSWFGALLSLHYLYLEMHESSANQEYFQMWSGVPDRADRHLVHRDELVC